MTAHYCPSKVLKIIVSVSEKEPGKKCESKIICYHTQLCHHKRFGVHGFWTGHGESIDRSRIGLLIKLAGLFFNGSVEEIKHGQ